MASTQGLSGNMEEVTLSSAIISKVLVGLIIVYLVSYPIYALYFHPLSSYPGGILERLSRIPYWIACLKGNQANWMLSQHRRYGATVRFAPNDISYTEAQAWRDINLVPKNKKENGKEIRFHAPSANGTPNLITEPSPVRHAIVRRVFSPAFSEKALKKQEPLFQHYANLMVSRGRQKSIVNMTELLNWTTFDIMAEFAFGESLGLLENGAYSDWVATVFNTLIVLPAIQMIEFYPFSRNLFRLLEPKSVAKMRLDHFNHTVTRVDKRLKNKSHKPDLWNLVEESGVLTTGEIYTNAELFMTAGTETTASLLTGTLYYLFKNPNKMKTLTDEIRGRFTSNKDITFEALCQLDYLNACLREGLRVYPSIPSAIPREIPEGGNIIMGKWLPAGTRVSVHQTATYRSPTNFRDLVYSN
ncbi:putative cytochrome p450 monooxygenase [Rosellinia necatrix]|uniref:Putative cytochrome p450 monooxygenase n=1 Tax=Rosellinia necatrix TaxID=77044 RepID=A0A1W2TRW8_ROSNE|nr:putative cytochrome p450 monooxygenase [Rosellinia necatrix]